MSITSLQPLLSRLDLGHAQTDITPPVGIYHRLWGAARHDRASGVHRPLRGDLLVMAPLGSQAPPIIRVQLDLCGLVQAQHDALATAIAAAVGVGRNQVMIGYSHTHSSGWFVPDRIPLPGGELIEGYLADLAVRLAAAAQRAAARLTPAIITYTQGHCTMAANRDYWDESRSLYACGFNPAGSADTTVLVGRVDDFAGRPRLSLVHYACHPTTLAWESSLISPDFAGAMRTTVEAATGVPCLYLQGICGDLGPRHGFVGDPAVADRNGRQLAYAALNALETIGPTAEAFCYSGPVLSGATLGRWDYQPPAAEHLAAATQFAAHSATVDLPLRSRPDRAALVSELATWESQQTAADSRGDEVAARDFGARAERARRWLARLNDLPPGDHYPVRYSVLRLGDAYWVTCGGEPYNLLQTELRRRFPDRAIIPSPLDGDLQIAYLLPRDRYGQGLYQEEPSSLGPGALERLIDTIAEQITALGGA